MCHRCLIFIVSFSMLANLPLLDFLKLLWNVTWFQRNKSNLETKKCLTISSATEPSGAYLGYPFTGWALYALPPYYWSEPTWPRSQKRVWYPTFPWLSPSHTSLRLSLGNLISTHFLNFCHSRFWHQRSIFERFTILTFTNLTFGICRFDDLWPILTF